MSPRIFLFPFLLALAGLACAGVDVNTASLEDLQKVRGIGPATAARIVAARAPGPFRDTEDLQDRVRGFGPTRVRKLVAAGLSVPSVRIAAVQPPRGPEVIAGHPPDPVRESRAVCAAPRKAASRDGPTNTKTAAQQRKPKAPGPA